MAAEDVVKTAGEEKSNETNVPTEETSKLFTLEILKVVKEAQQQHGLRHGDYQRYRGYCSRRLRRLRKVLHFQQGDRRHFKRKDVSEDALKDERFLYFPLMMAERAWSYAMQLKQESNTEQRKKFHLIGRLRKAATYAIQLQTLCESQLCDARTKLEAQAYVAWIHGTLHFELQMWKSAMENLKKAQVVYQRMADALPEDDRATYLQRVEEITPSLRYCAYSIGDQSAMEDLIKMREQASTTLVADLDTLISQTRESRASVLSEVEWRGRSVPVRPERVRNFLLAEQELGPALARATDDQTRISLIENLLLDNKDSIQAVKEELKNDPTYKTRAQSSGGPIPSLQYLLSYLLYIRLTRTVERNLLMAEVLKKSLQELAEGGGGDSKKARPQDLIRLYEIILQNLQELQQLPGLEDDLAFVQEVEAKTFVYRAFRGYHIARSLASMQRWGEAMAMFHRTEEYVNKALKSKALDKSLVKDIEQLQSDIAGEKFAAHAHSILGLEKEVDVKEKLTAKTRKPLSERLDQYLEDPTLTSKQPPVYPLPPDFQPIPCKPLFFDLALNHVEYPSLEDKLEGKKQTSGISGFVKGLWGWGGKK